MSTKPDPVDALSKLPLIRAQLAGAGLELTGVQCDITYGTINISTRPIGKPVEAPPADQQREEFVGEASAYVRALVHGGDACMSEPRRGTPEHALFSALTELRKMIPETPGGPKE